MRTQWTSRPAFRLAGAIAVTLLIGLCYFGFFSGTYFSQDDFIWLCFAKFFDRPGSLFSMDTLAGQFFRPMGQLWWMVVHSFAGANVGPYQAAFLATHLLNAWLGGRLASRIAGPEAGWMVGLLFALSPIFVSPMSRHYLYIFDTLGCTFLLGSLLLVMQAARRGSRVVLAGSLLLAVGAYFSKESYYTLPAVAALMLGISQVGARWSAAEVYRQRWLLAPHVVVAISAWLWRWSVVGRIGGYGLVQFQTFEDVGAHVFERFSTMAGFTAWSLLPCFSRYELSQIFPLVMGLPFLVWLTWRVRRSETGPGPWWCWAWIFIAWLPSVTMTTYAAVSFYPAIPASALLFSQLLLRYRPALVLLLAASLWNALHGALCYAERRPEVDQLKLQEAALAAKYSPAYWRPADPRRLVLVEGHPDLMPDAAVKYHAPPGTGMSRLFLFNDGNSVNWLITDPRDPGDLRPLVVSKLFQDGMMDMPPYRAYPMELGPGKLNDHNPDLKLVILLWEDDHYIEVQPDSGPGDSR